MPKMDYSVRPDPETSAIAIGRELHCSPKHAEQVVRAIKGMTAEQAKAYLDRVVEFKQAVPFLTENHKVHHRRGQGFGPGAWPVKAAGMVKKVVENVENNAEYKGLDADELIIVHASAFPGRQIENFLPRAHGRASPFNETTTNVELVLGPRPGEEEEVRRRKKPAAGVEKVPGRRKAPEAPPPEPERKEAETKPTEEPAPPPPEAAKPAKAKPHQAPPEKRPREDKTRKPKKGPPETEGH